MCRQVNRSQYFNWLTEEWRRRALHGRHGWTGVGDLWLLAVWYIKTHVILFMVLPVIWNIPTHIWLSCRINSRVTFGAVRIRRWLRCCCRRDGCCSPAKFLAHILILLITVFIVETTSPYISLVIIVIYEAEKNKKIIIQSSPFITWILNS